MKFQNRLQKLEVMIDSTKPDTIAIFILIVGLTDGKPKHLPILGWHIENGDDVMRLEGETDDDLQNRAALIAIDGSDGKLAVRLSHIKPNESKLFGGIGND